MKIRTLLCGCCTNGCICHDHENMLVGAPATVCEFHSVNAHPLIDCVETYYEGQDAADHFFARFPKLIGPFGRV